MNRLWLLHLANFPTNCYTGNSLSSYMLDTSNPKIIKIFQLDYRVFQKWEPDPEQLDIHYLPETSTERKPTIIMLKSLKTYKTLPNFTTFLYKHEF